MNTERLVFADEVWEKVSPHLPGKATDCGVTAADNRLFLEAVLWRQVCLAPNVLLSDIHPAPQSLHNTGPD